MRAPNSPALPCYCHIQLRGYIDHIWNDVDIEAYAKVPLLPSIPLGEFKGRLTNTTEVRPDVPEIITGLLRLFMQEDRWFTLEFSVTIFGSSSIEGILPLVPFPGAVSICASLEQLSSEDYADFISRLLTPDTIDLGFYE